MRITCDRKNDLIYNIYKDIIGIIFVSNFIFFCKFSINYSSVCGTFIKTSKSHCTYNIHLLFTWQIFNICARRWKYRSGDSNISGALKTLTNAGVSQEFMRERETSHENSGPFEETNEKMVEATKAKLTSIRDLARTANWFVIQVAWRFARRSGSTLFIPYPRGREERSKLEDEGASERAKWDASKMARWKRRRSERVKSRGMRA